MGQSIWFQVLSPWAVRQSEVKAIEKQGPPSLTGIEALGSPDVLKVFMVGPHQEGMLRPLQPMSPFLEGDLNRQQLLVTYVVVSFSGG